MSDLDPTLIFDLIATELPADLHDHVLIVGSLAAAYHYRERLLIDSVNTKDADVVVQPAGAIEQCKTIANRLLAAGWYRRVRCVPRAGCDDLDALEVIRLHPPSSNAYFLELLAFPRATQNTAKELIPIELVDGWYVLPAFRHLRLLGVDQRISTQGLRYAAPQMMALSNLLAHRSVGTRPISEPIEGRTLLRSAKDLGRTLALARLAERDELDAWPESWARALRDMYLETEVAELGAHAGDGLRELLTNAEALEDAHFAVDVGLLRGHAVAIDQLRAVAEQLIDGALARLAELTAPTR